MGISWNSSDRLLLMVVVAAILHAVVILGVGFEPPTPPKVRKSLEIALVRTPSAVAPKKADYLAPEHQFGGGEAEKKSIPKTAQAAPPATGRNHNHAQEHKAADSSHTPSKAVIHQAQAEKKIAADSGEEAQAEVERPHLTADLLRQQISEFSAEFTESQSVQARRTRTVYINSVNAHKYKAAAYERAWQDKVERIGNLNYPDEARRRNLSGSLLLSVGIRADGSIQNVQVRRSSGHPVLDDAAVRIVRLASPFAPFPVELKEEADILVVTRTWKFLGDNRVETAP